MSQRLSSQSAAKQATPAPTNQDEAALPRLQGDGNSPCPSITRASKNDAGSSSSTPGQNLPFERCPPPGASTAQAMCRTRSSRTQDLMSPIFWTRTRASTPSFFTKMW